MQPDYNLIKKNLKHFKNKLLLKRSKTKINIKLNQIYQLITLRNLYDACRGFIYTYIIFCLFQLDDATLQVFKDGDYGPYLDLDSTLGEQDEELEGLQDK